MHWLKEKEAIVMHTHSPRTAAFLNSKIKYYAYSQNA